MVDDTTKPSTEEIVEKHEEAQPPPVTGVAGGDGGWGGWGFSAFSYISDIQKAATTAAEEISRNAVEAAKTAAKSFADVQNALEDSESLKEDEREVLVEEESEDENDKKRKAALEKLEKASEESLLGQGLKVIDHSVENFAAGAWQALGNAFKGSSELVHKLENSAVNIAESVQHGDLSAGTGSVAPSILETGKAFTAKGMHVLELLGKETMDLLISETGIRVDPGSKGGGETDEDQFYEEVTFDRCFYIYGGPEQLEELEALSNHYALLFNRRKAKIPSDQRSSYDGKLKEVQEIFDLSSEVHGSGKESGKGKEVETGIADNTDEVKNLHDSSVNKAAELAAGFTNILVGLAPNDMVQRTTRRLDTLHSEGVHRLSELCCFAVTQLVMLGKSIISAASKVADQDADAEIVKMEWPEDSIERAKLIRAKACSMTGCVEAVSSSFITGISEVAEAYIAAVKGVSADSHEVPEKSIQDKANTYAENLRAAHSTAMGKIQDGLQYLPYVVISTSMPAT